MKYTILTLLSLILVSTFQINAQSGAAKNRQDVMDDGYTFFEADPVKERSEKYRGDIAIGWTLNSYLRAFGTYPDNSGFKIEVLKGGSVVATYKCQAKIHRKEESPVRAIKNSPEDNWMSTNTGGNCADNKTMIKTAGKYDVKIYVINGATDEEKLLRSYKIDVRESKNTRPGGVPGVSDFYIQRHAESAVAILYLRPGRGSGYAREGYYQINSGTTLKGNIDIYFNVALAQSGLEFDGVPYIRCKVNGKPLSFTNKGQVKDASQRGDQAKAQISGQPLYRLGFYQYWLNLPIEWKADGSDNNPNMEKLAGEWEIELRSGMETVRTFKFTVDNKGYPVEHPEQKNGNINLAWGSYLVQMDIPAGGSSIDYSLLPAPNEGLFYGIPWSTPEGKKMGTSVPTKGEAFLK
jgi:hypothetical protein